MGAQNKEVHFPRALVLKQGHWNPKSTLCISTMLASPFLQDLPENWVGSCKYQKGLSLLAEAP